MADDTIYFSYQINDQYLRVVLKDGETDTFLNDASSVTCTLKDENGADVPNFVAIPLTLVDADAFPGLYRGVIPNEFNPEQGSYFMWMHVETAGGLVANIRKKFKVDIRTE